jgi:hypothetical protein
MRDSTKVIIGFGSIWGLYAFGAMVLGSFTIGVNDSAPEVVAILLYGLTVLPSCILAIWFRKYAATWLLMLFPITAFGFIYQTVQQGVDGKADWAVVRSIAVLMIVAAIPGLIGVLLFRSERSTTTKQDASP